MSGKQVTGSMLKDESKIYQEYIEIPINVKDEEYIVKMYPYFKPDKVKDCVKDITIFFQSCGEQNFKYKKNEENDIVFYFIVKHFTDIKLTSSKKVKTIYGEYKALINSDIGQVLMRAFPEESIQRIYTRMLDVLDASAKIEESLLKNENKVQEDVR